MKFYIVLTMDLFFDDVWMATHTHCDRQMHHQNIETWKKFFPLMHSMHTSANDDNGDE